jgi:uncharacterized DUF497 family protein
LKRENTFECDKSKARSNFAKHGIRFTEGCRIFDGHALTLPSKQNSDTKEERYVTIGALTENIAAVVIWTKRREYIRVISVRPACRAERERFNAYIQKTIN